MEIAEDYRFTHERWGTFEVGADAEQRASCRYLRTGAIALTETVRQLHERLTAEREAGEALVRDIEQAVALYEGGELGGLELLTTLGDAASDYRRSRHKV